MSIEARKPTDDNQTVQEQITKLQTIVDSLSREVNVLKAALPNTEMQDQIKKIFIMLNGDKETDTIGVRQRLANVERTLGDIDDERKTTKATLRGMALALGLTGVTSLSTLVTVISQVIK